MSSKIKNLNIYSCVDNPEVLKSSIFNGKLTGYPSIDRPWLKYYPIDLVIKDLPRCSIYRYIYDNNKKYSYRTALNYFGNKISYDEMFKNIDKTAAALVSIGVREGDIVTISAPTLPETIYLFYALAKIGAISNMIDPRKSPEEIVEYVNLVGSKKVFAVDVVADKLINLKKQTNVDDVVLFSPSNSLPNYLKYPFKLKNVLSSLTKKREIKFKDYIDYSQFIENGKEHMNDDLEVAYKREKPVVIVYTGGTTGRSKGVVLTNDNINAASFQCENCGFDFQRQHKWLNVMPPFIAYGVGNGLHLPLACGMEVTLIPQFNPNEFDKILHKVRPNHMTGVPTHYDSLLSSKILKNEDLNYIFSAIVGGDKLDVNSEVRINKYLEKHNCNYKISKGYGLTEACAAVCVTTNSECNKVGSVGIPFSHTIMSIFDQFDINKELKYGEVGEICITGPNTMLGYYNNEIETKHMLRQHADGKVWVHSGDVGYIDQDGCVYVIDRIKNVIIRHDGFKVYPIQITEVVMKHENVCASTVIGVRNNNFSQGELPKLYVVLKDENQKEKTIQELNQLCVDNLAEYLIPSEIEVIKELPKTSIGKIDFMKLKKEEEAKVRKLTKNSKI